VPYPATNGSVRARGLHWLERLAKRPIGSGQVVVHGPGFPRAPIPRGEPVLLLRNARRVTRGRPEARLLRRASPGVYDLDDGLPWDDGRLPGLGRWWKRPFPRSLLAARAAAAADCLIAGNEVLAEWGSSFCSDTRIVPTCIEPAEYRRRHDWGLGDHDPVVGWIGSQATEHYLRAIAPALQEMHRRLGCRVVMISGEGEVPADLAGFTTRRRWTPESTLAIADWDVGIMPLADGVYERAKCGYKLLQYAASGVPSVGSPVGVNASLLADMDGFAAHTIDDWVDALTQVVSESPERRQQRALHGLAVAERYSYDAWESRWVEAVGW
jgi:glycosyltransferase involved in cell wall biosynthesis